MTKATKDNWKESMSFLSPTYETHTVGSAEFSFYPVSVATMFTSRNALKPLAQSLRVLFAQNLTDQGQTRRQVGDATEILVAPISPELAKLRKEQADKALSDLVDAVTDEKNATVLGQLLVDSLRDTFERNSMDPASCLAFVKAMDGATLADMIVGLAKGNKKLLGPFGDLLSETLGRLSLQITNAASALKSQSERPTIPTAAATSS